MKTKRIKTVTATYIESGAFQGGEEDVYLAKIKANDQCIVLKEPDFEILLKTYKKQDKLLKALDGLLSMEPRQQDSWERELWEEAKKIRGEFE